MTQVTRYFVASVPNPALVWGNKAPGYTQYSGYGHFEGKVEPCEVIEVIGVFDIQWCTTMLALYAKQAGEDSILVHRLADFGDGLQSLAWLVYQDTGDTVRWEKVV